MNARSLTTQYKLLTPEERFSLILSAGVRGDEAEQQRLVQTGKRIYLSVSDHLPWALAFDELSMLVLFELLEEAAKHDDAFQQWCELEEDWNDERRARPHAGVTNDDEIDDDGENEDEESGDEENDDEVADQTRAETDGTSVASETDRTSIASTNAAEERTPLIRSLDIYLAQGFILKTKLQGWKLFCERLNVPAFALWELLPGYARLQRAMHLLEDNEFRLAPAFKPEGMLHWANRNRRASDSAMTMETLISPERYAASLDHTFRDYAKRCGG